MRKIILLLFIACFAFLPVYADMTSKEEQHMNVLMARLNNTKSVDDYNVAIDYYIKLSKKYNETINLEALDSAVAINIDRYNTVQQVKYRNNAKRYAIYAIQNGTTNLNTIITGMTVSAEELDTSSMIKFYDYMCKVNPKAGAAIKDVFTEHMVNVRQNKANVSAQRWNAFNTILYTYIQNRPTYSTTTGVIDANGFVNLNTISY